MAWEWIGMALPWVLVLACPLAMFWMMRGMHGSGSGGRQAGSGNRSMQPAAVPVQSSREREVQVLKERLARLEAQRRSAGRWS